MAEDKVSNLYKTFVNEGYDMEPESDFRENLKDAKKRRSAYDSLVKEGYDMEPYEEFEKNIGYGVVTPAQQQAAASNEQTNEQAAAPAEPQAPAQPTPSPAPKFNEGNVIRKDNKNYLFKGYDEEGNAMMQPEGQTNTIVMQPQSLNDATLVSEKAWQPTEQQKIAASYNINRMLNDFNEASKTRLERSKRIAERNTPEGRQKAKAGEMQARMAGVYQKPLGIISPKAADGSDSGDDDETGKEKREISAMSPRIVGVEMVDGQQKPVYELADGRRTTSYTEADMAEYAARNARMRHNFEKRMKKRGLDPTKAEDVENQLQYEARNLENKRFERYYKEAEAQRYIDEAMKADEEARRSEDIEWQKGKQELLRQPGYGQAYQGILNAHEKELNEKYGGIDKLVEDSYKLIPEEVKEKLMSVYMPENASKEQRKLAEDIVKARIYADVHEAQVGKMAPQSKTEFFVRKVLELNPFYLANNAMTGQPQGQAWADLEAMERYGQDHRVLDLTGTGAGMVLDPTMYVGGWAAKPVVATGTNLLSKAMFKGATKEVAQRALESRLAGSLWKRIAFRSGQGAVGGAINFGTYEAGKEAERQMYMGGTIDPETGQLRSGEYSVEDIVNRGVHGLEMGGAVGAFTPLVGNLGDLGVRKTTSAAGKAGLRTAEFVVSKVGEGTIFSIPEWIEGKRPPMDVWEDNMAMMIAFGAPHAVGSTTKTIDALRAKNRGKKTFSQALAERMDDLHSAPQQVKITNEDLAELREAGYGKWADLFKESESGYASGKNPGEVTDMATGLSLGSAEEIRADGQKYEEFDKFMHDGNVPAAIRAKMHYIMTGHTLPMPTVAGWRSEILTDEKSGKTNGYKVQSFGNDGQVITSRIFKNEEDARKEQETIQRQAELNTIDVGEQYAEQYIGDRKFADALERVQPGGDFEYWKGLYEKWKNGEEVGKNQDILLRKLEHYMERNEHQYNHPEAPEAIRERIKEDTGVDVDEAIMKDPADRTEVEDEAVKTYAKELFDVANKAKRIAEEPKPETPEQEEAQSIYEESKLLPGRFFEEQGEMPQEPNNPVPLSAGEAKAEMDAIVYRMQEAYQLFEEAFGGEADYYRFHLDNDPWGLANDPTLTPEQKDAVLYYINSKAALDGVMDGANEAAQNKMDIARQEIDHRTNKDSGMVQPAVMKVDDKPVYIVKGNVVMYPDGSAVDHTKSSDSLIILDPSDPSGDYKWASVDEIFKIDEPIDPQVQLRLAEEQINAEHEGFIADMAAISEGSAEGNGADLSGRSEINREISGEGLPREGILGEGQTLVENGAEKSGSISNNQELSREDGTSGDIVTPGERGAETAMSKIPVDDQTGKPIWHAVSPDITFEALVEKSKGNEERATGFAEMQLDSSKKAVKDAEKIKISTTDDFDEYDRQAEARQQAIDRAKAIQLHWERVLAIPADRRAEAAAEERALKEAEEAERKALARADESLARVYDEVKDTPEALEHLRDLDPKTIDEVAALVLSGNKLMWNDEGNRKGVKSETGFGEGERRKMFSLFTTRNKGGKSLQKLAEDEMKQMCEAYGVAYDNQEARNALIEMIQGSTTPSDIRKYIERRRAEQALGIKESILQREAEAEEEWYFQNHGMGKADWESYQDMKEAELAELDKDFDEEEYNGYIADQIYELEKRIKDDTERGNTAESGRGHSEIQEHESTGEGEIHGRGGEILLGEGSAEISGSGEEGSGLESDENGSGVFEGNRENIDTTDADVSGGTRGTVGEQISEAEAQVNTEPTEKQKEAGNYKMGHVKIGKFDMTIENPKGSVRSGVDADGKAWSVTMQHTYGYIKGTKGVDGDHIDVYASSEIDGWNGEKVFVIDQYNPDGTFDEHKVMLGFNDKEEAYNAYLSNYEKDWEKGRRIDISSTNLEDFEKWIESSKRKTKPFAEYKTVKKDGLTDNQGNPVDEKGNLIIEDVNSIDEITDEDFENPTRNIGLRPLTEKVSNAIGANGRRPIIKKNILEKNRKGHKDLTPQQSREILHAALYEPSLYGQNQKETRPYNWIVIHLADRNSAVIVEVSPEKENLEIVNWHYLSGQALERKKNQAIKEGGRILTLEASNAVANTLEGLVKSEEAEREDGQLLILPSENSEEAGALSGPTSGKPSSESKDSKNSEDRQIEKRKVSATIIPTTYTNKKGKTSDISLVKFSRDLTDEEREAAKRLISEPLSAGKKTPKGWYDRNEGGYMMRSEEAAKELVSLIDNPDGTDNYDKISDNQPLSREDLKRAIEPKKEPEPKKPANEISIEEVVNGPEPQATIIEDIVETTPQGRSLNITEDMKKDEDILRDLLGIGEDEVDGNVHYRLDELTPEQRRKVYAAGVNYSMGYIEQGLVRFEDFALAMSNRLGEKIKPWLKSFYEGVKRMPGYEDIDFTPTDEVDKFDIDSIGQPGDIFQRAETKVEERKVEKASKEAEKELIAERNKQRKQEDEQTTTNTKALEAEAKSVGKEADTLAKTSTDEREINAGINKIDDTLNKINKQLGILGYYESSDPIADIEKRVATDGVKLAQQFALDLGINFEDMPEGRDVIHTNFNEKRGIMDISLPIKKGYEPLQIEVAFKNDGQGYKVSEVSTRLKRGDDLSYVIGYDNRTWLNNPSYKELLDSIKESVAKYLPKEAPKDKHTSSTKDSKQEEKPVTGAQTPILKQYDEMKKKHPDAILLFRVGDFYEVFKQDAEETSKILGITLTKRSTGDGAVEMAGFPHHALDSYLPKLVRAGRRVAICEQLEDPKLTKKLAKRARPAEAKEEVKPQEIIGGLFDFDEEDAELTRISGNNLDLSREESGRTSHRSLQEDLPLEIPEERPTEDLSGDSADFQKREKETKGLVSEIGLTITERLLASQMDPDNTKPLTMRDIKKMVEEYPGLKGISDTDLQELVELAMTQLTRNVAMKGMQWGNPAEERRAFDKIVGLYQMQPSLNARDSERLIKQQYSTPTPFGYVMGQFVQAKGKRVNSGLEPSAGNGALTITFNPRIMHVNDIDQARLANLRKLGFGKVTAQNALLPFNGEMVDVVLTNPPFGTIEEKVYDGIFKISSLEGQMAINALDKMKDDGRAAIVIGGNTSYRTNGSMNPKDAAFFGYLYSHYNVADVINISGKALYSRNGTGYDVRMILIDGRKTGPFQRVFPPVQSKARAEQVTTFDELYNRVQNDISNLQQVGNRPASAEERPDNSIDRAGSTANGEGVNNPNTRAGERPTTTSEGVGSTPKSGRETANGGNEQQGTDRLDNGDGGNATGIDNVSGRNPEQSNGRGNNGGGNERGTSGNDGREAVAERPSSGGGRLDVTPENKPAPIERPNPPKRGEIKADLTTEKVPYPNQSNNGFTLLSVVPAAQAEPLKRSLEEIGDVDQFLIDKLGYSSKDELYGYLAAEQIDSVALAINQMNKGNAFIIGDMTGVGKGRQGAALIRYAVRQGKTPIYFTQKPTLFTDNYRDLSDIGSGDLRPFIIASNPKDANIVDVNGNVVHKLPSEKERERVFKHIMQTGKLPEEYDYVLVTYDQIKNGTKDYEPTEGGWNKVDRNLPKKSKGYTTADQNGQKRRDALELLAIGNITILDESHTVGGDSGMGRFMQMLTKNARGVTFLSATFAKRADNMPIYAQRTAMSEAGVTQQELIEAINKGGVTLQEIMSKQLVESGQMIRRERSFEGVTIDWLNVEEATDKKQREQFNEVARIFNDIRSFQDEYVTPWIEQRNKEAAEYGATVGHTQGTKDMGVKNVPFASKMYNLVNQLLFALKVDAVADRVIWNLQNGFKPVISFTNTMEGFLSEAPKGVEMDEVPDFSLTLMRALDGVMRYTNKDADENTEGNTIKFSELPPEAQEVYNDIRKRIESLSADLPISPMDAIRMKIEEAGYSVAEITGRTVQLSKTENGKYIVSTRQDRDKKANMRDFNSGKLDVLMINKSGSTGISLHASSKFEDQRQRVMVFAQFQSDINDEVQMRGRIDRSGQVTRGRYEYIMSTIPAEQRIQMMFKAKLKSLDANTTSSQKSKFNEMEIVDYLNKYGDEVVWDYMTEHPELEERLGDPLDMLTGKSDEDGKPNPLFVKPESEKKSGAAGKISRYLAFLPVEEQDAIFKEITEAYRVKMQLLDDAGENDLEITTMPLNAETISKKIWQEGSDPNGSNAFADNTYVEEVEVDVLKKPMKKSEIEAQIRRNMGDDVVTANQYDQERYGMKEGEINWRRYADKKTEEIKSYYRNRADETIARMQESAAKKEAKEKERATNIMLKERAKGNNDYTDQQIAQKAEEAAQVLANTERLKQEEARRKTMAIANRFETLLNRFSAGQVFVVPQNLKMGDDGLFTQTYGIFTGFKFNKTFTLGSSTATFATLDGRRKVELALSDPAIETILRATTSAYQFFPKDIRALTLDNWDEKVPNKSRQKRYIITGNLLQALVDTNKGGATKGNLISYTTKDGDVKQGILMSENFKPSDLRNSAPISSKLAQIKSGDKVTSENGDVSIERVSFGWEHRGDFELRVPKSKQRGGQYSMEPRLLKLVDGGNFTSKGNNMVAYIRPDNLPLVLDILSRPPFNVTVLEASKLGDTEKSNGDGNKFRPGELEEIERANEIFNSELESYISRHYPVSLRLNLGYPMGELRGLMPQLPIVLSQRILNKANLKKHNVDLNELVGLPGKLSEPIFIFQRNFNSIGVLTEIKDRNGKNVCVAIDLNKTIQDGKYFLEVNDIRSIHGRNVENIVLPILQNNTLRFVDKEKGLEWLSSASQKYQQETAVQDQKGGLHSTELNPQSIAPISEVAHSAKSNSQAITLETFEDVAKVVKDFDNNKWRENKPGTSPEAKTAKIEELSNKLHIPVRIISDVNTPGNKPLSARERRAKGWYDVDNNEVVIVEPNNVNVADVENTFVHEVVGHKGLRVMVGEERMDEFVDEIYNHASDKIKDTIDKTTQRMVNAEADRLRVRKSMEREKSGEDVNANYYTDMAEARSEAEAKRDKFRREATEEYMSDMAGRIGDEGFEKMSQEEQTLWGRIKAKVQQFLDKFLKRLKIAKGIRLTDKDIAYILYKSWKNMRDIFDRAEDVNMRRKTGYDADDVKRFRDPGMGLEETITKLKAEAMQANADNLQAKRDAMRAIGGNLNHLRSAMARQRAYDITTVKSITDLARVFMDNNLLDDLSKTETKRILGAVNNVVGRQDVSRYVQKIMDIMVDNQLRIGQKTFSELLSIKGSRVDARGVEVQGILDPDGQRMAQVVRKSISLPKDDIETRIAEALNRMGSTDQATADEAAIEYAGLQIAHQYAEDITESKAEEKELRNSLKQAKEDKDAGQMTEAAYKQYVQATEDAIRQNKIERAEAYQDLIEAMSDVLGESVEKAKAWKAAEVERVKAIQHNANSDMEGRPTDEHHKNDRVQKIANNSGVRFLLAPLGTFDQMLRMFGKKNARGEGYLWNRYMRGWVDSTEKEYTGYRDSLKILDNKVSEVFGKKMSWGDLFTIDRKLPKGSVKFWDGGEMKDHELTQGNLLYIYMADKMADGRMKLRRMGITEEDVEDIKSFLDPRFIELADWMQDEFLVDKRNEYNEVHKRMFGASMAAIENYFPLKILANARLENVDVAESWDDTQILPATITGSIIKRRRNNLALDVTGANAFSVILDHLQQMERWAAFAEFNRDLNTLLSYKRFRNQVMNMSSAYGAGKMLWNNFRNVCSMAAGAYRPPIAALDKAAVNIAKGVTAAKVSFRVFTALKQFLSMPAYVSDSNPIYLAKDIVNPIGAWKWSMKNLPIFEKRWKSRMAGDPRLMKSDMDWKAWRSNIVQMASRVGMSPNAFVDALTVAIGTHAMYQTKLAKYLRQGFEKDVAEKRAKQDATILFNQTQQSSEGAFLSTMQVDRSWLSVLFTVFRNSSMSYTRQLYDAIRNLKGRISGDKELSTEFMAKQLLRAQKPEEEGNWSDEDWADARKKASAEYRNTILRDLVKVGIFGYVLQMAWNLGAYLPYLILGEDEEEKGKMWDDVMNHSFFGSIEGLTGGDVLSSAGQMAMNGETNWSYLVKDMPLASDLANILKKMPKDQASAMNDVVNLFVQSGVGVNPQSLTDAVVAVIDACGDDAESQRECALLIARIINCPQSQIDKIYLDELDLTGEEASKMTPAEIAERYAEYKLMREAPLTGWTRSQETEDSIKGAKEKRVLKVAKEKITGRMATEETKRLLSDYDEVTHKETELNKLKKTDREAYKQGRKELRENWDLRTHKRVKRYKKDMDELTEKYLRSRTPEERDSIAERMLTTRDKMLEEVAQ